MNLKYKDIAKEIGVSNTWLSTLMRHDLSPENRKKIMDAIKTLGEKESAKEKEISAEIL